MIRKFFLILIVLLFPTMSFAEDMRVDELLEDIYMEDYFEEMYAEGVVLVDSALHVREKPFCDSAIVGKLYHGAEVFITGKCNGYYKIGEDRYISEEFVYISDEFSATGIFIPENMKYLRINYMGQIDTRVSATSVTSGISLRFLGEIPIYDIVDGYAYFPRGKNDIFKLPMESFSHLEPVGEKYELLSAYRTTYKTSGGNASRADNIELVSTYIDGVVINPGKTFSFNEITGPRSKAKGYQLASAYQGEEVVQDYGGGVCQVSSTIYSAVRQCTGIAITERKTHSMRVDYLPEELEATVSYDHIDFKFMNNYDFPVKLSVHAEDGVLLVKLYKLT